MDINQLEANLVKHLEESGAIRADLAWLKKAFWIMATANVTFNITLASSIIMYLMNGKGH